MNNIQVSQLEIKKRAFIKAANLVTYMDKYRYYMDKNNRDIIDTFILISEGLPLPSGRWGNAIALALEVNNYVAAEYLIDNANRLKLDTNTVVSELGGKNPWSLKDEYLYSQLTYDDELLEKAKGQSEDNYKEYVNYITRNKEANERLEKKLSITEDDKKVLS